METEIFIATNDKGEIIKAFIKEGMCRRFCKDYGYSYQSVELVLNPSEGVNKQ